jgi:hypothetical protein
MNGLADQQFRLEALVVAGTRNWGAPCRHVLRASSVCMALQFSIPVTGREE